QRRYGWQYITRKLGLRNREEKYWECKPRQKEQRCRSSPRGTFSKQVNPSKHGKERPRKNRDEYDRNVEPEGLDVLEFRSQVALEVVFDDEDAEEVGVASGAEDAPGQCSKAEGSDCGGMEEAERVAPALGKKRPKKD